MSFFMQKRNKIKKVIIQEKNRNLALWWVARYIFLQNTLLRVAFWKNATNR